MKKLYIVLSLCVLCVATSVSVSARTNSSMSSLTQLSTNITNETIYTDARETIEVCIPVVPYSQDQFHIEYKYTLTHRQSEAERSWQTNNSCRSMLIPFEGDYDLTAIQLVYSNPGGYPNPVGGVVLFHNNFYHITTNDEPGGVNPWVYDQSVNNDIIKQTLK